MPTTLEVKCASEDYELDVFELHHTCDIPDDVAVADLSCPYCDESHALEEIQL